MRLTRRRSFETRYPSWMVRPLILVWVCALASCSPDVFETDGGSDASMDTSTLDASTLDAGDAPCPYSGDAPICGTLPCTPEGEICCVQAEGGAMCTGATFCLGGTSLACLTPMDCPSMVCCLLHEDAGGTSLTAGPGCPRTVTSQAYSACIGTGNCIENNGDHRLCLTSADCPTTQQNCVTAELGTFTFGVCVP